MTTNQDVIDHLTQLLDDLKNGKVLIMNYNAETNRSGRFVATTEIKATFKTIIRVTKAKLKTDYIAALQAKYDFYIPGSRAYAMAHLAVNQTLAGRMNLQGECWFQVLRDNGLSIHITRRELAALPEK